MSLIRRSFSKHYCPSCGAKLSRKKPSFAEGWLQEVIFWVPLVFIWLVCAGIVQQFGGGRLEAAILGAPVAWLLLNPWFFAASLFECGACNRVFKHHEVICRGWGIVI